LSFTFGNLRDNSDRLNMHTKLVLDELTEMIRVWQKQGIDSRAIYSGLAVYHQYYGAMGAKRTNEGYMIALESEAHKLATAMLQRDQIL
jgi:hypothetical protein